MNTPHMIAHYARCPVASRSLRVGGQRGFTLIEILVTAAVLATVIALAVPAFAAVGRSIRLTSLSNTFMASLHLARSEAIKRNDRVVMCASGTGTGCAVAGDWSQGWLVFHDANSNGALDAGEVIVHRVHGLPPGYKVSGNLPVARYVSFAPTGGTRTVTGAFQAGTVTLCRLGADQGEARQVVISSVGRPRLQKVAQLSCL